jgi:hypothetical protein
MLACLSLGLARAMGRLEVGGDRMISWAEIWAQILGKRALQKFSYYEQRLAMVGAAGIEPATSPV